MHPRFLFFPWQKDYAAQPNIFCPYVMSVAQPGYRSASLNIDQFGFRWQYDADGEKIDLLTVKERYKECTLLLGNSASFGVSLRADGGTLGHHFAKQNCPCINLSVRGATMQQELAIFQVFKHLLPPIKKIILLTGICDVSLATQQEDICSPVVGAMNSKGVYHSQYLERVEAGASKLDLAKREFMIWAERQYLRSALLQGFFERRLVADPSPQTTAPSKEDFDKNLQNLLALTNNVMETWGWIKTATGTDVVVALQPVLGWTTKEPTVVEKACLDADLQRVSAIPLYVNTDVYARVKDHFDRACRKHGLTFLDANACFDSLTKNDGTLFTDICHLTDRGTQLLAHCLGPIATSQPSK